MPTDFQISSIYRNIFGTEIPESFYVPDSVESRTTKKGQPLYENDMYGREMFMPVKMSIPFMTGTIDLIIPFAVVSISRRKTVVETAMPERSGTVKELINAEDYSINIKGIIIRPDNEWPEDEIIKLKSLQDYNQNLVLRSALTDIFLSGEHQHKVVLKSFSMPATPGVQNAKAFDLDCVSDSIFELTI